MKGENFWKAVIKKMRYLNPVDRIFEVLFELIMVLLFAGGLLVLITIAPGG